MAGISFFFFLFATAFETVPFFHTQSHVNVPLKYEHLTSISALKADTEIGFKRRSFYAIHHYESMHSAYQG